MIELNVQKYLRSGKTITDLNVKLGINFNFYESLVILSYDQIDSPKTHPIILECRGLVLEINTWDIICYPFKRFFNYGETANEMDFKKCTAMEKIDGSMISVFYYKDKWYMATRSVIENKSPTGFSGIPFNELFFMVRKQYQRFINNLNYNYTYCFELVSPENRNVTIYKERELYLLTIRNRITQKELPLDSLELTASYLGVSIPKIESISDKDSLIEQARKLHALKEGYVVVDYSKYSNDGISFDRVKVKNPAYVAIHHLKNTLGKSLKSLVSLILDNQVDEFLVYFPEFSTIIKTVEVKYNEYITAIKNDVIKLSSLLTEDKKTFAMQAQLCTNPAFMFNLYNKRSSTIDDFFKNIEKVKGRKNLEKYIVNELKLKDIELYKEI